MTVRARGQAWQADLTVKGTRHRADFSTRAEAETWEAEVRLALLRGLPPPPPPRLGARPAVPTLAQAIQRVAAEPPAAGGLGGWRGTANETKAVANAMDLAEAIGHATPIDAITTELLRSGVQALEARGNGPATVNRKLAAVAKVLSFYVKTGLLDRVPALPRREEPEGRARWLTPEEAQTVLSVLEGETARLVAFLLYTGARYGEAAAVTWGDVETTAQGTAQVTLRETKNGTTRTVPIPLNLLTRLGRRGAKGDHLFTGSYRSHNARFNAACAKAGVPVGKGEALHLLRHTCGTWLAQRGVDIRRIQVYLGHKDIATTTRYVKVAAADLQDAAATLPAL